MNIEELEDQTGLTREELKKIGITDDLMNHLYPNHIPDWDEYFMGICGLIAQRSKDANSQFGCLFVRDKRIIASGYNGYPPGCPDELLPNTREGGHKYKFFQHAEENAILNAARNGIALNASTLYCLGHPCSNCTRQLIGVGVTNWVIGSKSYQANEKELILRKFWTKYYNVKITAYGGL